MVTWHDVKSLAAQSHAGDGLQPNLTCNVASNGAAVARRHLKSRYRNTSYQHEAFCWTRIEGLGAVNREQFEWTGSRTGLTFISHYIKFN